MIRWLLKYSFIIALIWLIFCLKLAYGKDYNTMYPRTQKVIDLGWGMGGECFNCTPDQQLNIGGFVWYMSQIKDITIMEEWYSLAGGGAQRYSFVKDIYPKHTENDLFYIEMLAYQIIYADKVRIVEDRLISLGVMNYVRKDYDCRAKNYKKKNRWVCKMKTVYRDGIHNWK